VIEPRCLWFAAVAGPILLLGATRLAPAAEPQPFDVRFSVEWKGMNAGSSSLTLRRTGPRSFRYESRNTARGLFQLAFPGDITQTSEFELDAQDRPRPLRYLGDDGSREGRKDVALIFDWEKGRVSGMAEQQPVDLALQAGVQDPMTVQIAVMLELAAGRKPERYFLMDKDEVKEYVYTCEGSVRIRTALGELETIVCSSSRPGSNRITRVWYAPSLGYAPVRAQRVRGGKTEITMLLRRLSRSANGSGNGGGGRLGPVDRS
jgi:hypothetical protein